NAVRQRKQYGIPSGEQLRTRSGLVGFNRDNRFGLTTVRRHAQNTCRSSAEEYLVIRTPAGTVRKRAITDGDGEAARYRNSLELVFRPGMKREPPAIRRKERRIRIEVRALNRPRLRFRHGPKVQLVIGHVDEVCAIRRKSDQMPPSSREALPLGKDERKTGESAGFNGSEIPCNRGCCGSNHNRRQHDGYRTFPKRPPRQRAFD